MASRERVVFISHVAEEAQVAGRLKELIERAFGQEFVFLSSDYENLRGGDDWYDEIVRALKGACVTVSLLSPQSVGKRWINFEAGVAIGAHEQSMPVIPVVFRGLRFGEIGHPLSPKHGRDLHEEAGVAALLTDISEFTKAPQCCTPSQADLQDFVSSICALEKALPSTGVVLKPSVSPTGVRLLRLQFRLSNEGSQTVRPTRIEVGVPFDWLAHGSGPSRSEVLDIERPTVEGSQYQYISYKRLYRDFNPRLDRFTPLQQEVSPGESVPLHHVAFEILPDLSPELCRLPVRWRVYAQDLDLPEGTFSFEELLALSQ